MTTSACASAPAIWAALAMARASARRGLPRTCPGVVTALAACWRIECGVTEEHDESQLYRISVPSGDHSPGDLALLRFTLSFRDVEDLLAERGIAISYETIRRWVNHFRADHCSEIAQAPS